MSALYPKGSALLDADAVVMLDPLDDESYVFTAVVPRACVEALRDNAPPGVPDAAAVVGSLFAIAGAFECIESCPAELREALEEILANSCGSCLESLEPR